MSKRATLIFAVLALVSGCSTPQMADYKSMFAIWTVVSAEEGGHPAEDAKKADLMIDSEVLDANGNAAIDVRWTDPPRHRMKIDVTTSPKHMDVSKGTQFGGSDPVWPGIY